MTKWWQDLIVFLIVVLFEIVLGSIGWGYHYELCVFCF